MGMVLVAIAMSMFASGAKGLLPARLRSNRVPNDVFADEYSKTREDPATPVPCCFGMIAIVNVPECSVRGGHA